MRTQRAIATVMILAASILIAAVFRDVAFPAILCILGLLGLQRRFTWDIRPERRVITSLLLLLLALLFAVHYRYADLAGRGPGEHASIVAWETIARYFLASMILISFLGSPQRLPPSLGLFYMASVIATGQVLLLDDFYMAFRLLELVSVILIILYAATGAATRDAVPQEQFVRRDVNSNGQGLWQILVARIGRIPRRWAAAGLILCLALNLGWILSSVLYRHVELLNYVPVWLWHGATHAETLTDGVAQVGFSTSGELSSILLIKGEQDTTPALTIASDINPGYLRAKTFDHYRQYRWFDVSHKPVILPTQSMPLGALLVGKMPLFRLRPETSSRTRQMMIRHELPMRDTMFAPLGVTAVEAPLELLVCGDNDIISPHGSRTNLNYMVTYGDASGASPATQDQIRQMLDVPLRLNPRINELADRIFANCTTTAEKITAVVNYFQANYTYSLGLSVPPDRDRLEYFLLESSTGYCEYFASGAAILLRLADVPTRYVTGFLVTAKNDDGETWVARNMDAHAWVEAWDRENRRWTIVEATVQEGLATAAADDLSSRQDDAGSRMMLARLSSLLREYGLFGVLAWGLEFHGLPVVSFLLATTLAGICWGTYRRVTCGRAGRDRHWSTPQLLALHRMLVCMDRRARAAGARRQSNETLDAFSRRIRSQDPDDGLLQVLSDWYTRYAELRYCRIISPDRLHRLQRLVYGKER